jgi:hypothetical protein
MGAKSLQRWGVLGEQATQLSARLANAEAKVDSKRVDRLDSFGGIMDMGARHIRRRTALDHKRPNFENAARPTSSA